MKDINIIKTDNDGFIINTEDGVECYELKAEKEANLKLACKVFWKISDILGLNDMSDDKKILIAMVGRNFEIPKDA